MSELKFTDKIKADIKKAIEYYCEGISYLEFSVDDFDNIINDIEVAVTKANDADASHEPALHKHDVNACTWKEKLEALIDGLEIENKEKLINDGDVETYKMLGEVMSSKIKQLKYWR